MAQHPESSNVPSIFRNGDALSDALRKGRPLEIDDIARLIRTTTQSHDDVSSIGTSSTTVPSACDDSANTKPTSAGTSHPKVSHTSKGKGKQKIDYASSLEGTHGSASEAEVVRRLLCRNNLAALGDWADAELHPTRVLRGSARAKDRQHNYRRSKNKKPVLVLQHEHRAHGHDGEHAKLMVASSPSYGGTASSSVVHDPGHDEPSVRLAEEGQQQLTLGQTTQLKSLSRARKYSIMGLITLMGCTVLAAAYATHLTGRSHMSCTRCIVFAATVALAFLTVLAMLIARRALSEALLAGLLELVFGFALLAELNDIM